MRDRIYAELNRDLNFNTTLRAPTNVHLNVSIKFKIYNFYMRSIVKRKFINQSNAFKKLGSYTVPWAIFLHER